MRITLDHRGGLPTSKTLQLMRRRTILPMQCCPRVAQIMPAKFSDPKSGSYPAAVSWADGSQGGSGRVILATT
jgi:hypothetical protein